MYRDDLGAAIRPVQEPAADDEQSGHTIEHDDDADDVFDHGYDCTCRMCYVD